MTTTDHWEIAHRICTPRELEALKLHEHGLSYRMIALHLGVSTQRAHQLVRRSGDKIQLELTRKEPAV